MVSRSKFIIFLVFQVNFHQFLGKQWIALLTNNFRIDFGINCHQRWLQSTISCTDWLIDWLIDYESVGAATISAERPDENNGKSNQKAENKKNAKQQQEKKWFPPRLGTSVNSKIELPSCTSQLFFLFKPWKEILSPLAIFSVHYHCRRCKQERKTTKKSTRNGVTRDKVCWSDAFNLNDYCHQGIRSFFCKERGSRSQTNRQTDRNLVERPNSWLDTFNLNDYCHRSLFYRCFLDGNLVFYIVHLKPKQKSKYFTVYKGFCKKVPGLRQTDRNLVERQNCW